MTYFTDLIDKTSCIGNTLSTINLNASALDNNLWNLSAYTTDEFTNIYTQTGFLSSSIISTSANLYTVVQSVSTNSPTFTRNTIYQQSDGTVNYDFSSNNSNAVVTISANGFVNNISNISDGDYGKLLVKITPTSSVSITGWGTQWIFSQNLSTMNILASANNLINYYYDSSKILAHLLTF